MLDIICGSGKSAVAHPGNKRFQIIVAKHSYAYEVAKTKKEKAKLTQKILDELLSLECTRFLKKDPIFERFYIANKRVCKDKISHCLREKNSERARRVRVTSRHLQPACHYSASHQRSNNHKKQSEYTHIQEEETSRLCGIVASGSLTSSSTKTLSFVQAGRSPPSFPACPAMMCSIPHRASSQDSLLHHQYSTISPSFTIHTFSPPRQGLLHRAPSPMIAEDSKNQLGQRPSTFDCTLERHETTVVTVTSVTARKSAALTTLLPDEGALPKNEVLQYVHWQDDQRERIRSPLERLLLSQSYDSHSRPLVSDNLECIQPSHYYR